MAQFPGFDGCLMLKDKVPHSSREGSIMTLIAPPISSTPLTHLWECVLSKFLADDGGPAEADSPFSQCVAKDNVVGRSDASALPRELFGTPSAHKSPLSATCDVAIGDWDVLLSAVKARLRLSVSETFATPLEPHLHDQAERIRSSVLECVDALDQLHETLSDEFGRRTHL